MTEGNKINENNFVFSELFNHFFEQVQMFRSKYKCVIIYGAGTIGKTVQKLMGDNIVAFVDIAKNAPIRPPVTF